MAALSLPGIASNIVCSFWWFLYHTALDTPVKVNNTEKFTSYFVLCFIRTDEQLSAFLENLGDQRVSLCAATFSITWVCTKYKVVYHVSSKLHWKWKSFLLIAIVQWIKYWLGKPAFSYFLCLGKFKLISSISRKNHHYNCRL